MVMLANPLKRQHLNYKESMELHNLILKKHCSLCKIFKKGVASCKIPSSSIVWDSLIQVIILIHLSNLRFLQIIIQEALVRIVSGRKQEAKWDIH